MMSTTIGATRAAKSTAEPTGHPQSKKPPAAPKAILTVDRTDDVNPPAMGCDDVVANDCSLRGAVIKANTTAGTDTIALSPGTYTLTIAGIGEEAAMTGDLDLTQSVIIQGAGAASTIIQAGTTPPVPTPGNCTDCIDRVFHVTSSGVTADFMNLTIRHGKEPISGAGIFNSGTARITNSTLSNNVAGNGGGIFNLNTAMISNSTLSNNSASNLGGGFFNANTLTIKNSIVANSPSGGDCVNSGGTFTALGKNFDTDGTGAALDPDFMQVTPAQLNLGPLQNNGGPTQTHDLLTGSVAIDAVTDCARADGMTAVTQDQRGATRPLDGDGNGSSMCDVGAYEAPTCGGVLTPYSQFFTARGGESGVTVTALAGCGWSTSSNVGWIEVVSNQNGTGTEIVSYVVRENFTGIARQGAITIAGQPLTVYQGVESATACVIAIAPTGAGFSASGGRTA
jgi:hypothetical protein